MIPLQKKEMYEQRTLLTKAFIIAGERSGVGKTTVTLALAQCFINRGLRVQCFKVGPDFIDPAYHKVVTGRLPRNLDGWMMGRQNCLDSFYLHSRNADVVIVEGVMGLYDGYDGRSDEGSTAQIAKWLNLPVVLIIDGSAFARSAGAVVLGFERYDPAVTLSGVVFNNTAGERHFTYLKDGVMGGCKTDVLGYITRYAAWEVPERHLGLVMPEEIDRLKQLIIEMSCSFEQTVDTEKILQHSRSIDTGSQKVSEQKRPSQKTTRIGVSRDEAFCFSYQDNIECLENNGAEVVFFSPIHDQQLPEGLSGLYLCGGYPELYAEALSKNKPMREDVFNFCRSGKPVYAECGGFLYLLQTLIDHKGTPYEMAGFFPGQGKMCRVLQRLGYVEVITMKGCPFLGEGEKIRGHEFHYSDISQLSPHILRCYRVQRKRETETFLEGYTADNVLASYIHLHFASNVNIASGFVHKCRMGEKQRGP